MNISIYPCSIETIKILPFYGINSRKKTDRSVFLVVCIERHQKVTYFKNAVITLSSEYQYFKSSNKLYL
jgi:hypothetical protein